METLSHRLSELPVPERIQYIITTELTAYEQQVIVLELENVGRQKTARLFGWSESTVRTTRQRAWAKLGRALVAEAITSERVC